jgi:hypothetical protein
MLYVGAVEGSGRRIGPKFVYRMSDEQANLTDESERIAYASEVRKPGFIPRGKAWYADTSREPVRDESIRQGLMSVGAVVDLKGVAVTSSTPRYMLAADFAELFNPTLEGAELDGAIKRWQATHLSRAVLTRMALERAGAVEDSVGVQVGFPNGESRRLSSGPSSIITKAVIEEFATRFLSKPAVLWLSDSGTKVQVRDEFLARKIGLNIDPAKSLPDIILADAGGDTIIVFVEVVASDGPVSEARRKDLLALVPADFPASNIAFVTAFLGRGDQVFRNAFASIAWNSFVWFASDPDRIVALVGTEGASPAKLRDLLAGC